MQLGQKGLKLKPISRDSYCFNIQSSISLLFVHFIGLNGRSIQNRCDALCFNKTLFPKSYSIRMQFHLITARTIDKFQDTHNATLFRLPKLFRPRKTGQLHKRCCTNSLSSQSKQHLHSSIQTHYGVLCFNKMLLTKAYSIRKEFYFVFRETSWNF